MTNEDITTPFSDEMSEKGTQVKRKVSETATKAKDKVEQFGRNAADTIDSNRGSAASGLESAATALHEKADNLPGGQAVTNVAHQAADKLGATADYVRQTDVKGMMTDVEQLVRRNPGQSLVAAAVVGFLVGRVFRND